MRSSVVLTTHSNQRAHDNNNQRDCNNYNTMKGVRKTSAVVRPVTRGNSALDVKPTAPVARSFSISGSIARKFSMPIYHQTNIEETEAFEEHDAWIEVFKRLDPVSLGRCTFVCRHFRRIICEELLKQQAAVRAPKERRRITRGKHKENVEALVKGVKKVSIAIPNATEQPIRRKMGQANMHPPVEMDRKLAALRSSHQQAVSKKAHTPASESVKSSVELAFTDDEFIELIHAVKMCEAHDEMRKRNLPIFPNAQYILGIVYRYYSLLQELHELEMEEAKHLPPKPEEVQSIENYLRMVPLNAVNELAYYLVQQVQLEEPARLVVEHFEQSKRGARSTANVNPLLPLPLGNSLREPQSNLELEPTQSRTVGQRSLQGDVDFTRGTEAAQLVTERSVVEKLVDLNEVNPDRCGPSAEQTQQPSSGMRRNASLQSPMEQPPSSFTVPMPTGKRVTYSEDFPVRHEETEDSQPVKPLMRLPSGIARMLIHDRRRVSLDRCLTAVEYELALKHTSEELQNPKPELPQPPPSAPLPSNWSGMSDDRKEAITRIGSQQKRKLSYQPEPASLVDKFEKVGERVADTNLSHWAFQWDISDWVADYEIKEVILQNFGSFLNEDESPMAVPSSNRGGIMETPESNTLGNIHTPPWSGSDSFPNCGLSPGPPATAYHSLPMRNSEIRIEKLDRLHNGSIQELKSMSSGRVERLADKLHQIRPLHLVFRDYAFPSLLNRPILVVFYLIYLVRKNVKSVVLEDLKSAFPVALSSVLPLGGLQSVVVREAERRSGITVDERLLLNWLRVPSEHRKRTRFEFYRCQHLTPEGLLRFIKAWQRTTKVCEFECIKIDEDTMHYGEFVMEYERSQSNFAFVNVFETRTVTDMQKRKITFTHSNGLARIDYHAENKMLIFKCVVPKAEDTSSRLAFLKLKRKADRETLALASTAPVWERKLSTATPSSRRQSAEILETMGDADSYNADSTPPVEATRGFFDCSMPYSKLKPCDWDTRQNDVNISALTAHNINKEYAEFKLLRKGIQTLDDKEVLDSVLRVQLKNTNLAVGK